MTIRLRPGARPKAKPESANPPEAAGEWLDSADANLAASAGNPGHPAGGAATATDCSAAGDALGAAPAARSDTNESGRAEAEAANSDGQPALAWAPPAG